MRRFNGRRRHQHRAVHFQCRRRLQIGIVLAAGDWMPGLYSLLILIFCTYYVRRASYHARIS